MVKPGPRKLPPESFSMEGRPIWSRFLKQFVAFNSTLCSCRLGGFWFFLDSGFCLVAVKQ